MKIYSYCLRTFGGRRICIGKQGENLATRIDVDVTPWKMEYPTGIISLFVVPPVGNGYLAALEENGNTVRWLIRDIDTASIGIGKVELIFKDEDGTVIKSATAYTSCVPSISSSEPSDPPEAIRPWVEQILDAIQAGGGTAQADWDQTNELAPDYIKNKPIEETEDDAIDMLTEMGLVDPVMDEENNILTDEDSNIFTIE